MAAAHLMPVYAWQDVTFTHGQGAWLWDKQGKKYLDFLAGIAANALGHAHPKLVAAICEQAGKLMHVSNGFLIQEQLDLAAKLTEVSGMENAFFCSTGAEANETAIKLVRLSGNRQGKKVPTIVVMERAFHGRTMATITASGNAKVSAGFEPLVEGFIRCPYNNLNALRQILAQHDNIVAVMLEPIQGEGGILVPDESYLPGVRQLCDEFSVFMILDEVQTGIGRTGKMYAYQHYPFLPDIVTSGKGLGAGYPIAACLARGKAAQVFEVGQHGTTYGGNPLASRIGLTVLNTILEENLLGHVSAIGDYLQQTLRRALAGIEGVAIRGKGLMVGVELPQPCAALRVAGLDAQPLGWIFNVTAEKVIRLVPPLIITREQVDIFVSGLTALIKATLR